MRKILAAGLTALAMAAAGAAPAAADDAGVRRVLEGPRCGVEAGFERMQRISRETRLGDTPQQMRRALQPLRRATDALKSDLVRCAGLVRRQRASTPAGTTAQRMVVEGLLTMRDGLDVYGVFFELVDAASYAQSKAEARRILRPLDAVLGTFERLMDRGTAMLSDADRILRRG